MRTSMMAVLNGDEMTTGRGALTSDVPANATSRTREPSEFWCKSSVSSMNEKSMKDCKRASMQLLEQDRIYDSMLHQA